MKFQPDRLDGVNAVSRLETGRIWVLLQPFEHGVVVPWQGAVSDWPARQAEDIQADHLQALVALQPELVILGTGARQRFLSASVLRPLIEARIGYELMDTAAACRTYNVLVNEGRRAVGAFIL
ncbi:Mth938-like domain-containing protein [Ideonella livida]|uniref:Xcc1710-like domain-containing protein n=1 Tax=Ideonella livida TaxID=2707176 RepID=A0A7C9PGR4_9BURK|nr:Mth938-like domain-containing protein [Ideonella livida]NDY90614.1 Xcc1710-like domain-containing protein [Ideonella livida]